MTNQETSAAPPRYCRSCGELEHGSLACGARLPDFLGDRTAITQSEPDTIINLWARLTGATRPCPGKFHHYEDHKGNWSCLDNDTNPIPDCKGTGQVHLLPRLWRECPGYVEADRPHEYLMFTLGVCSVCGNTGQVPIAPDAIALEMAMAEAGYTGKITFDTLRGGGLIRVGFIKELDSHFWGTAKGTDPLLVLCQAAIAALGLPPRQELPDGKR